MRNGEIADVTDCRRSQLSRRQQPRVALSRALTVQQDSVTELVEHQAAAEPAVQP